MKLLWLVLVTGCLLAALPAAASAHYPNRGAHGCPGITLTPNTDHGITKIRARRTSCAWARRVASRAAVDNVRYPYGYTCKSREHLQGMHHGDYRCAKSYTKDGRRLKKIVTFAVS